MPKRKPVLEVPVIKDEDEQQPVPTVWRPVFREIVKAFVQNDYRLKVGVPGVAPVSAKTAKQIKDYIVDYGETLVELPEETWSSSVCLWMGNRWDVIIDLWTKGEGRSDLILSTYVTESKVGFVFQIYMVYVP